MSTEVIQCIAKFMQRVKIKPEEIPTWQTCMQYLGQISQVVAQEEQQKAQEEAMGIRRAPMADPESPLQKDD